MHIYLEKFNTCQVVNDVYGQPQMTGMSMDFFNFNYISTLCNEANHANTKQSIDIPLCFQEYVIKAIVDHIYYNIDNYNSKIIPIMKVTQSYDQ